MWECLINNKTTFEDSMLWSTGSHIGTVTLNMYDSQDDLGKYPVSLEED